MSSTRSYRCYYYPRPDEPSESGVLPYLQVRAADAEQAAQLAYATMGKPIARCERIEPLEDTLELAATKALPRRFTGEPITGFGAPA